MACACTFGLRAPATFSESTELSCVCPTLRREKFTNSSRYEDFLGKGLETAVTIQFSRRGASRPLSRNSLSNLKTARKDRKHTAVEWRNVRLLRVCISLRKDVFGILSEADRMQDISPLNNNFDIFVCKPSEAFSRKKGKMQQNRLDQSHQVVNLKGMVMVWFALSRLISYKGNELLMHSPVEVGCLQAGLGDFLWWCSNLVILSNTFPQPQRCHPASEEERTTKNIMSKQCHRNLSTKIWQR